jgi:hypothetical protein
VRVVEAAKTVYVEAGARVGDRSRIGAGGWLDHDLILGDVDDLLAAIVKFETKHLTLCGSGGLF